MVVLKEGDSVPERSDLEVAVAGSYEDTDLVLCRPKKGGDPVVQYQAYFISTGSCKVPDGAS